MTWQYRRMRKQFPNGEFSFGIYEYYESIGKSGPGWTSDAMDPHGETPEELRSGYEYMAEAFKHPVLDYETGKVIRRKK